MYPLLMAPEWLRFGKKEAKEFRPDIKNVKEVITGIVDRVNSDDYSQLRKDLIFWEGGHINPENIFVEGNDTEINVLIGTPSAFKKVFTIGLGEDSLYFDNRNFPNSMVFRSKPYNDLKNEDDVKLAIYEFIQKRPKEEEFVDISRETLEAKMNKGKETQEIRVSSIQDFRKSNKDAKEVQIPKRKPRLGIW